MLYGSQALLQLLSVETGKTRMFLFTGIMQ
jgi:hypothetical protein